MRALASVLALLLALAVPARAEWVAVSAERIFPPDLPETEACRAAEERAREEAIRRVTGERLSSEELMVCTEQNDTADCSHNSTVWTMVDGDIRAVRGRTVETAALADGLRRCTVALEAEVVVPPGRPDPAFDIGIHLNATVFRDQEPLEISLSPSQPMAVAVFQWLPYEKGEAQVARIFPNPFDTASVLKGLVTIPTEAGRARYSMRVGFPAGMPAARRMVDEYLMVVATRRPVSFREAYALDDFRARLLELPRSDSRVVRKAYSIVRGGP
ncbi:MAG: DUF4384 domain-containing protein [Magnetospirillum sp.]|nr:MAG: DUF4384 domain-containing protein [Magnetospirillum sp.]